MDVGANTVVALSLPVRLHRRLAEGSVPKDGIRAALGVHTITLRHIGARIDRIGRATDGSVRFEHCAGAAGAADATRVEDLHHKKGKTAERSQNSPRSPNLIEITISLKLCEVGVLDSLDGLRAV